MKHKRILVAVSMLLLSAVLLSSASYAWFSMNTDVNVDGIEFEAYSDSLFLEISENNTTFSPNDLTITNDKKALRPVAYGYIGDLSADGKVYSLSNIQSASGYYTGDAVDYYERQVKAASNDTKVGSEYDYIRINDKLELPTNVSTYFVLGTGLVFEPNTDPAFTGDLYAKEGNDYVKQTSPANKLGLYRINGTPSANGADPYVPGAQYYSQTTEGYYLVNGINAGSHLEGYYTLTATDAGTPTSGNYYLKNSDGDYVAFAAHATGTGLDGYWYRGYSENIDPAVKDSDAKNIVGVIGGMDATNSPYVLYDTIYLRMAKGAADATNLVISNVDVQGSDDTNALTGAVRVIFIATSSATGNEVARILYDNETGEFTNLGTATENNLITSTLIGNTGEVITVDMYVYYDGTHSSVATHNLLNLSGHKISVGFEIDLPEYAK